VSEPIDNEQLAVAGGALVSGLDAGRMKRVLSLGRVVRFASGATIFAADAEADALYVILVGRVKVYKVSIPGEDQILHLYGPAESFGTGAVLAGGRYPAWAQAVEPVQVLRFSREAIRRALAFNPDLALGMMAGLSSKLQEFAALIEQLSLKDVPGRLAAVLLDAAQEADAATFTLRQMRRQLAAQIGTVPKTLSRALAKLTAAGLIRVKGRRVTVRDARGLRTLTEG